MLSPLALMNTTVDRSWKLLVYMPAFQMLGCHFSLAFNVPSNPRMRRSDSGATHEHSLGASENMKRRLSALTFWQAADSRSALRKTASGKTATRVELKGPVDAYYAPQRFRDPSAACSSACIHHTDTEKARNRGRGGAGRGRARARDCQLAQGGVKQTQ